CHPESPKPRRGEGRRRTPDAHATIAFVRGPTRVLRRASALRACAGSECHDEVKHMANTVSNKERMKIPRQHMPERPALIRAHNFEEVNLGFDPALADQEAIRCL